MGFWNQTIIIIGKTSDPVVYLKSDYYLGLLQVDYWNSLGNVGSFFPCVFWWNDEVARTGRNERFGSLGYPALVGDVDMRAYTAGEDGLSRLGFRDMGEKRDHGMVGYGYMLLFNSTVL